MTVDGVAAAQVARPETVAQVQDVVRDAAARRRAIVACGTGAHLDIGAVPARVDVLVALDRLDRVVDHQAADMTVTVEAGCRLSVLSETLARAGQWLPLDPPRPEATTVGGLVAANLSGSLRASQGRVRDLLLGLRTVDAEGALVAGGGRVVKNVAGYDLPKLHVGALGTLGPIVEATFKVRPRPAREEAVVIACRAVELAAETALATLAGIVEPFWLEIAGPGELPEGPGEAAAVVVGLAGLEEEVTDARDRLLAQARARGVRAIPVSDGAALRTELGAFPVRPAAAVLRAAMLPSDVGAFLARVSRSGTPVRSVGHAANGVVRIAVADDDAVPGLVATLRPELEARGGSLVVERATPAVKARVDVWGDPGPGAELMRAVKRAFDPHGMFAPGRFVCGI
ncbi:MAG TPA: FAD-binding oxidoreductase [Candidatus Binatia bacterium]|nr:FAD-binding oxidoreductase [Candidatus Binatia bacterium]